MRRSKKYWRCCVGFLAAAKGYEMRIVDGYDAGDACIAPTRVLAETPTQMERRGVSDRLPGASTGPGRRRDLGPVVFSRLALVGARGFSVLVGSSE